MDIKNIIAALLIFTVIVVIHELGHFLLAKKNGITVTEFSVGMGPRIITFGKTKTGLAWKLFCSQKAYEQKEDWKDSTKYSWKLFPIGGSCIMVGEDSEDDSDGSFNKKGVWARFSVIFAGPLFNFILAFVFSIIILGTSGIDIPEVVVVYNDQPGQTAGIQTGDIVKSINGKKISIGREIDTYLQLHPLTGKEVKIVVKRDGDNKTIKLDPNYETNLFGFNYSPEKTAKAEVSAVSKDSAFDKAGIKAGDLILAVNNTKIKNGKELGIVMEDEKQDGKSVTFQISHNGKESTVKVTPTPYKGKTLGFVASKDKMMGPLQVLKYSVIEVKYWIVTTVASLGQLVSGQLSTKDISGPVGIVNAVGGVIEQSSNYGVKAVIINMLYMSVLLSANLGVMNLLPLPALDGGRLVFILFEGITGKPINREKEGIVHLIGFVLLMAFMVFVMYNDIIKIIR